MSKAKTNSSRRGCAGPSLTGVPPHQALPRVPELYRVDSDRQGWRAPRGTPNIRWPTKARRLLDAVDAGTLAGLRDRARLSVMLYSFARVSAATGMRRADYFRQGSRGG